MRGVFQPPAKFARVVECLNGFGQFHSGTKVCCDFLCALHKNSIRGAGGGEKNRAFFRHLGVEQQREHGREVALQSFPTPRQTENNPISQRENAGLKPRTKTWST